MTALLLFFQIEPLLKLGHVWLGAVVVATLVAGGAGETTKVVTTNIVSEQRSEAICAAKEIASSPTAPRNDRTLHLLMKSGSY